MKKLITIMASMATCLLFGDFVNSGTSFEAYETGAKTIEDLTAHEDNGEGTGDNRYWFYEGDTTAAIGAITNGAPNVPADVSSRPAKFADDTNVQYLDFTASDATNVFYRAINSVAGKSEVADLDGQSIDNGLYLDTLVKFTPGELTSLELGDGDKIALTYVEETDDEDGDGKVLSNIVVRAGYVNGSTVTPVNYVMNPIPGFSAADWHRLTVRAINVGYAKAPVGFVIYLDGADVAKEPLTYSLEQEPGDSDYLAALDNNSIVASFLYNTEKHALIPSAVNTGDAKTTLSAVGFKGNGCVDDISFTTTQPTFIQEGATVTIAWDANVATYTVVAGETKLVDGGTVSGAGTTNLLIDAGITAITVTATYDTEHGYEAGTWTVSAGTLSGDVWTFANGATLTINSMLPQFEVNGVKYGSFDDALDAVMDSGVPATIKLLADYTGDIVFNTKDVASVVIDLAGKTLTGDSDAAIHTGCANMIITNSTVEVGHVVAPEGGLAVVLEADAVLSVYAGIFDGEIADDSGETAALTIYGGSFYDAAYVGDPTNDFYLKSFVAEGLTISEPVGGYFTVSSSVEPPTPTVVQIPTAALNLVYTGNQQTGVAAGEGYTLSGTYAATDAGNYIATATLDQDCVWSDETTAPKEINWSIAADTSATVDVVLTDYEEEYTAQLAFPTASATIGGDTVVGTAAWSPDTITEPAAGATNTYTATFTVTSGNYAGSTGTATFKVFKAASSGGWEPDPSKIDPSATAADTYPELAETALATANAQKLTAWAAAKSIDFATVTGGADAYVDAFLLNCAPAGVEAAKADFKATITVNADGTVTVTAPGEYNVTPTIQGKESLSDSEKWHTKEAGDKFFRAVLSL